jgi:hypothetical protein
VVAVDRLSDGGLFGLRAGAKLLVYKSPSLETSPLAIASEIARRSTGERNAARGCLSASRECAIQGAAQCGAEEWPLNQHEGTQARSTTFRSSLKSIGLWKTASTWRSLTLIAPSAE